MPWWSEVEESFLYRHESFLQLTCYTVVLNKTNILCILIWWTVRANLHADSHWKGLWGDSDLNPQWANNNPMLVPCLQGSWKTISPNSYLLYFVSFMLAVSFINFLPFFFPLGDWWIDIPLPSSWLTSVVCGALQPDMSASNVDVCSSWGQALHF